MRVTAVLCVHPEKRISEMDLFLLPLSPSTVPNTVKKCRTSEEISIRIRKGREPLCNPENVLPEKPSCYCVNYSHNAKYPKQGLGSTVEYYCLSTQSATASRQAT